MRYKPRYVIDDLPAARGAALSRPSSTARRWGLRAAAREGPRRVQWKAWAERTFLFRSAPAAPVTEEAAGNDPDDESFQMRMGDKQRYAASKSLAINASFHVP